MLRANTAFTTETSREAKVIILLSEVGGTVELFFGDDGGGRVTETVRFGGG
jgi:hypothetical protein